MSAAATGHYHVNFSRQTGQKFIHFLKRRQRVFPETDSHILTQFESCMFRPWQAVCFHSLAVGRQVKWKFTEVERDLSLLQGGLQLKVKWDLLLMLQHLLGIKRSKRNTVNWADLMLNLFLC